MRARDFLTIKKLSETRKIDQRVIHKIWKLMEAPTLDLNPLKWKKSEVMQQKYSKLFKGVLSNHTTDYTHLVFPWKSFADS